MIMSAASLSTMAALSHAAGATCDWRLVAFIRVGLMLPLAAGVALFSGARLVFFGPPLLWFRSVTGTLALLCSFYSLTRRDVPISNTVTLLHMYPVWVTLLSWPLLKERPTLGVWAAVAAGMTGVGLIAQPQLAEGQWASAFALASSFFAAAAMLSLHKLGNMDSSVVVTHFSAVSSAVTGILLLTSGIFPELPAMLDGRASMLLFGVGFMGTIGQILMTTAFAQGAPSRVALVGLSQLGFSAAYDHFVWGRAFSLLTIAGMLLVIAPTAWLLSGMGDRLKLHPHTLKP